MKTEVLKFKDIERAKEIIKCDGVVAFPTETVYGLGARYDSFLAYNNIFEAKNRPQNKTLTLMLYDKNDVSKYAFVDENTKKVVDFFMPGEITLVLPKKENTSIYGSDDTIGIRIPDNEETLTFLKAIEIPMFVTSANLSGKPSTTSFDEVMEQLDGKIDAVIKGEVVGKTASTVVKIIDDKIEILREGPISLEEIEEVYRK